jgi:hypothetical protein
MVKIRIDPSIHPVATRRKVLVGSLPLMAEEEKELNT